VPHGEDENKKNVVPDIVDNAIVAHADSERFEPRELHSPDGARVRREREYPRLETPLD
jgi:hypothetical protein